MNWLHADEEDRDSVEDCTEYEEEEAIR